ncbi:hypothetical protein KK060_17325 [Fulvivirgaceae bacterium PWU20]|uniref:Uncharacterized protein n=2 Tax=Chryseosolibacter indicus TaxID=2782351 RepID=A0ABS5VUE5_9BACT|nr:hypothetical protein [Chryseosolibacter indicus]
MRNDMEFIEETIAEVNGSIDLLVQMVREGYAQVRTIVDGRFSKDSEVNKEVSLLVTELQFDDLLTQKCDHVKTIQAWILQEMRSNVAADVGSEVKRNVFYLNWLQVEVAFADYVKSDSAIKKVLLSHFGSSINAWETLLLFRYTEVIKNLFNAIRQKLKDVSISHVRGSYLDLDTKYHLLDKLYSMQSERQVLQAYIENPKFENINYLVSSSDHNPSAIDLF